MEFTADCIQPDSISLRIRRSRWSLPVRHSIAERLGQRPKQKQKQKSIRLGVALYKHGEADNSHCVKRVTKGA